MRVVLLTMDHHLAGAARGAARRLQQRMPGLSLEVHTAAQWRAQAQALAECHDAVAHADLVIVSMLFMEDHFLPVLDALQARRNTERFAKDCGLLQITIETLYDAKAHFGR